MQAKKKIYIGVCFTFAGFALLALLWSCMWLATSVSLAGGFCNNHFDLFHESFRCRQPYLALIAIVISGGGAFILTLTGMRILKKNKSGINQNKKEG